MNREIESIENDVKRPPLNLAIVGGGKDCKFFLEFLLREKFQFMNINLVGVCDINPNAEGFLLAKEMGIYTTDSFHDLLKIKDLDGVIEITDDREVLLELIRHRPKGVAVLDHNVSRIVATLFDFDRRLKSAERQVALERMATDFLIQQTNERIVVLNPDFTIVEANEAYLNAVTRSKQEVIGAHCYEITHGLNAPCTSSLPGMECPMIETLRTGESAHVIHERPSSEDHFTYGDMVTYPVKDQNGQIIRVIEIWRDITEELSSRWEKRVRELKDDFKKLIQEDRMISLGKLVASCVHEINNPIQGLLTFSHLMLDTLNKGEPSADDLKEFQQFLALMCSEMDRCGNIISGLLSFSREHAVEFEIVDLNEVLESVVALTRHKMELQDIYLSTDMYPKPLLVRGDVNQLQQCFLNLVFNAIEAMPEGGKLILLSLLDEDKKNARIEIQDTGCGIHDENLDHIFDPFFTTKEEGSGTGLGLSIVHGVVKTHGGEIEVKGQAGKGTSFILTFPAH